MEMAIQQSSKKMCVVLDTNIWVYDTYLLRSQLGASILYYINRGEIIIGLPEVVEQEIYKNALKVGKAAADEIRSSYGKIEILLGERDNFEVPSHEQISELIKNRLHSLSHNFLRVPMSLDHARRALAKVLYDIPPNANKQQFKDTLIWESIVELSRDYIVHFVTHDKAFFENKDPKSGLAQQLQTEIREIEGDVRIYDNIESFLNHVKQDVPRIDEDKLVVNIKDFLLDRLASNKSLEGIFLKDKKDSQISLYLTERPDIISVSFHIDFAAVRSGDDKEFTVRVEGVCAYEFEEGVISNLDLDSIIKFNQDGSRSVSQYVSVHMIAGRGTTKYSFKTPLR